jgi:hypothetical protein
MKSEPCTQGKHLNCLGRINRGDYPPNCGCDCHKRSNTPSHGRDVPNIK